MWKHIIGQGLYQLAALLAIIYQGPKMHTYAQLSDADRTERVDSIVFNTFIWLQWFNMFNARKIGDELNIMEARMLPAAADTAAAAAAGSD